MVDTCPPYHPDWLCKLPVFKVLRVADGPLAAYDRDFAYAHAYKPARSSIQFLYWSTQWLKK